MTSRPRPVTSQVLKAVTALGDFLGASGLHRGCWMGGADGGDQEVPARAGADPGQEGGADGSWTSMGRERIGSWMRCVSRTRRSPSLRPQGRLAQREDARVSAMGREP